MFSYDNEHEQSNGHSNVPTGGRSGKNTKAQIRVGANNNYIQIEQLHA